MHIFYFFGDSITLGVNVLPKDSFFGLLVQSLADRHGVPPTKFYNLGACKNSSKEILARMEQEFSARCLPGSTPFFILMCGVVDTMKFTETPYLSPEESRSNYRKLLGIGQKFGKILAVSPTPVANEEQNARLCALTAEQEKICHELNIPYLNIFPKLNNAAFAADLKDGVHPGEQGNRMIAELIKEPLITLC